MPALTGAAKSYSERLFRFPAIDRLPNQAARDALELPARAANVSYQRQATDRILKLTDRYPYFLQEYGKHVWNVAAGSAIILADVKRAHDLVQLDLDESFFQVRISRATQTEIDYLSAIADLGEGPYHSGEIATKLGRPGPASVAPARGRLIEKGPHLQPLLRSHRVRRTTLQAVHPTALPTRHRNPTAQTSMTRRGNNVRVQSSLSASMRRASLPMSAAVCSTIAMSECAAHEAR